MTDREHDHDSCLCDSGAILPQEETQDHELPQATGGVAEAEPTTDQRGNKP